MKPITQTVAALLLLLAITRIQAQGTAFTYQGRLNLNGAPVSGSHDLRFTIYDALASGNVASGPLTISSVNVSNGLFTVSLDFGAGVFTGPARWLQIEVRTNGVGNFAILSPRQPITATPYAIHAGNASNVVNGAVVKSLNNLRDNVTLAGGTNVTVTPNGSTLIIASSSGLFSANGTSAFYNGGNVGIGTSAPAERLTIAGVASYNSGLKLTGNTDSGTGLALENTSAGGHKYSFLSGGSATSVGAGGFGIYDDTIGDFRLSISPGGNVCIGPAFPTRKLTVFSDFYGIEHTDGNVRLGTYLNVVGGYLGTVSNHKLNFFVNDGGAGITLDTTGNVGIGTVTPAHKLTLVTATADYGLEHTDGNVRLSTFVGGSTGGGWLGTISNHKLSFFTDDNGTKSMTLDTNGDVGIGTTSPTSKLDVAGDVTGTRLILRADPLATANAAVLCADSGVQNFVPYNTALGRPMNLIVRDATVRQLSIVGGADLAEPFRMSSEAVPKGAVVVIDEDNPGQLELSTEAYDRRVAGVVSGANGIRPGISLHQEGELDGGENVALSGRVYVRADAAFGAIKPGDMLTTSVTPGHAMKVNDHTKAQGAILGKAMTGLKEGKGMVLVLVTLQ